MFEAIFYVANFANTACNLTFSEAKEKSLIMRSRAAIIMLSFVLGSNSRNSNIASPKYCNWFLGNQKPLIPGSIASGIPPHHWLNNKRHKPLLRVKNWVNLPISKVIKINHTIANACLPLVIRLDAL